MDVMVLVHFQKVGPDYGRGASVEITDCSKLYGPYANVEEARRFLRERGWTALWLSSPENRNSESIFTKSIWRPLYTRRLTAEIISKPHKSVLEFPDPKERFLDTRCHDILWHLSFYTKFGGVSDLDAVLGAGEIGFEAYF